MCASKREKLAAVRSMHELRGDGGAECAQRESISRIWLNLVHSRASKFDGDRATWSMQSGKKPVAARLEWPPCTSSALPRNPFKFNCLQGLAGEPKRPRCGHSMAVMIECFLSNTRPKTAFAAVQNACSSLPVEARRLMWACDGGGHPHVAPTGGSGALWDIGANR